MMKPDRSPSSPLAPIGRTAWMFWIAALLAPTNAAYAQAEPAGDWTVSLGAGALYLPDYEGSNDYEVQPFPYVSVEYRDLFFIRGAEIGFNLVNLPIAPDARIKLGPIARYRRPRDEKDNDDLAGLGDIDLSIEAGGFARVEYDAFRTQVSVAKDVAGGHDGLVIEAQAGAGFQLGGGFSASIDAVGSWTDRKYMRTVFGITPAQAAASGLGAYDPKSGFKDAGADIALDYSIAPNWGVTLAGGYRKLLDRAADSPIVRTRGSSDQFTGGLFLSYRF